MAYISGRKWYVLHYSCISPPRTSWDMAAILSVRHVRKVAESTRAKTCQLPRPGTTWQRITMYRVAVWRSDAWAAAWKVTLSRNGDAIRNS